MYSNVTLWVVDKRSLTRTSKKFSEHVAHGKETHCSSKSITGEISKSDNAPTIEYVIIEKGT